MLACFFETCVYKELDFADVDNRVNCLIEKGFN